MTIWPLLIVLGTGLVLAGAILAGPRLFPGTRPATRDFRCPFRERDVSVEFQETVWDGRLVEVTRCTYFTPPAAVDCHKGCLLLRRLPPAPAPVGLLRDTPREPTTMTGPGRPPS